MISCLIHLLTGAEDYFFPSSVRNFSLGCFFFSLFAFCFISFLYLKILYLYTCSLYSWFRKGRAVAKNLFFSRSSCCLIDIPPQFPNSLEVGKLKLLMNGMEGLFTVVTLRSLEEWRQLWFTLKYACWERREWDISVLQAWRKIHDLIAFNHKIRRFSHVLCLTI
jgi:hypothetical protein